MNEFLSFIRDFGSLINTVIILSLAGLLYKLFTQTISKKDATIELLSHQLETMKEFSVDNIVEKFRALKEYYEVHLRQWYDNSIRQLEEEKQKAMESKERELTAKIEEEMKTRQKLKERYDALIAEGNAFSMKAANMEICGTYTVVGGYPRTAISGYFGQLEIQKRGEVHVASWSFAEETQHFEGVGLSVGNTFSVTFKETSRKGHSLNARSDFIGIVTYEMVTPDIMRGYWAVLGDELLGFEECRKK